MFQLSPSSEQFRWCHSWTSIWGLCLNLNWCSLFFIDTFWQAVRLYRREYCL